jgi:hypothetical protein
MASSKSDDEEEAISVAAERVLLAQDVQLVHLLYGIEALDPTQFPWQVQRAHATKRFREEGRADDPIGKSQDRPSLEPGAYRSGLDAVRLGPDPTAWRSHLSSP